MTNVNKWSTTPANNATADGSLWPEGMQAKVVNNSARDNMASSARYRDDTGGNLTTAGSATAFTATTNSTNTDTEVLRDGFRICLEWHANNSGADPTLAVDGGTAKTIKKQDGTALAASDLPIGVRDDLTYNAGTGTFEVQGLRAGDAVGIANVVEDATPQLGGDLDMNGQGITFPGATVTDVTGADTTAVSGTAGTSGNLASWNADGDAVDASLVATAVVMLNEENQALTGGVTVTSKSLGTQASGTLTLDMGDRPLQHYTNGGAHTLAPGAVVGSCLVDIVNNGSAGAITTSGWTQVAGDDFDTTNTNAFRCHGSVGNDGSLLIVQAMQ